MIILDPQSHTDSTERSGLGAHVVCFKDLTVAILTNLQFQHHYNSESDVVSMSDIIYFID